MNWAETLYIKSGLRAKRLRQSVVPKLIELGGRTDGLDVLDIGCGPGESVACEIEAFGAASVTAIDLDPKMVTLAKRRLAGFGDRVSVEKGDVTNLPLSDGEVDAIFNFAVLHHVEDWRGALQEMGRLLAAGGQLFSQDHDVANHDPFSRRLFRHPPDRFTNAEFLEELEAVGFDVIGAEDRPEQLLVAARKRS